MKNDIFQNYKWTKITYKYKNFPYSDEIKEILNRPINKNDEKGINKAYENYQNLNVNRGYKYIIKDLYLLFRKYKFSTKQIADIYELSPNTVRIYIQELKLRKKRRKS